jgi:hypothetical protein
MCHFIGVLFSVEFVGSVEDEPLSQLKHGGHQIHILLEGELEILRTNCAAFCETLGS